MLRKFKKFGFFSRKELRKSVTRRSAAVCGAVITAVIAVLLCTLGISAKESYDFPEGSASVSVTLDGRRVLEGESAIIDDVTYVPLRAFSELMGAESVEWDASSRTATVKKYNMTAKVRENSSYIEASGRYFKLTSPLKNIGDRIFLPIRTAAKLFSAEVEWIADSRTVVLKSTNKDFVRGADFYSESDLYWLSRIISAEAKGESLAGKIAVGNVVLNRVESKSYPDTVYGVIFDRKHGTQFSPVSIGTIYDKPTEESVIAAKICLEGYSVSDAVLFFMNPRIATNNWISKNRPFAFSIGNHDFYY